jgi:hypothetical protein
MKLKTPWILPGGFKFGGKGGRADSRLKAEKNEVKAETFICRFSRNLQMINIKTTI